MDPPPPPIGRGPDIPVHVCKFENACASAVREVSRDARSVANLATLSLDLVYFQTPYSFLFQKETNDKSSDFLDKL